MLQVEVNFCQGIRPLHRATAKALSSTTLSSTTLSSTTLLTQVNEGAVVEVREVSEKLLVVKPSILPRIIILRIYCTGTYSNTMLPESAFLWG